MCSVCSKEETANHTYKTGWSKDEANHWHECSACGDKKDIASHTPGAAATKTKPQSCTVCGYIIKPALDHKHDYATKWTKDELGHWYACSGRNEKKDYAVHDFESACATTCNICGYIREITHAFGEDWVSDETGHWHECTICGEKIGFYAGHIPGIEASETTAQTCTVCGFEIVPYPSNIVQAAVLLTDDSHVALQDFDCLCKQYKLYCL